VLLISDQRWVLMHELRGAPEPSLDEQIARFSDCDLVLVEGFKQTPIPKLEVHRPSVGKPLIAGSGVETIVAVATDEPGARRADRPADTGTQRPRRDRGFHTSSPGSFADA
jgi:molybdopterin-guanine dinucleotide biosynthesis protein B